MGGNGPSNCTSTTAPMTWEIYPVVTLVTSGTTGFFAAENPNQYSQDINTISELSSECPGEHIIQI